MVTLFSHDFWSFIKLFERHVTSVPAHKIRKLIVHRFTFDAWHFERTSAFHNVELFIKKIPYPTPYDKITISPHDRFKYFLIVIPKYLLQYRRI